MSLFDFLEKILAAEGDSVEIEIPEENFTLLMLRILQTKAKAGKKKLVLRPAGPRGKRMLAALRGEEEAKVAEKEGKRVKPSWRARLGKLRRFALVPSILLGILLFLAAGAYGIIYYLPKAEVILTLNPIPLVKEISVTADTNVEEVDIEKATIPGTLQTTEESGEKSTPATATATVGEKAKGTVKFINLDNSSDVTFTGGSQIKPVGKNLVYLIDSSVTVPKRVGSVCGEKSGGVTAQKIGTEYNLGSATNFDFVNYSNSDYDAEATAGAIGGGTTEQVTVVAQADQDELLEELKTGLIEQGKESITSAGGIDEVIVGEAIKSEVLEKTYSHAVGERTEQVTLDLKVKLTIITYAGADIQELISQAVFDIVPVGFTLFPGETKIEPLDPKLSKDKLKFQAKVSAQVIPEMDVEKIKTDLIGRNPTSAQEYLSSLGEVTAYELKLWPNLPGGLQRIPRSTKRITVTLVTEEE